MARRRIGDKPLSEPMLTLLIGVYMRIGGWGGWGGGGGGGGDVKDLILKIVKQLVCTLRNYKVSFTLVDNIRGYHLQGGMSNYLFILYDYITCSFVSWLIWWYNWPPNALNPYRHFTNWCMLGVQLLNRCWRFWLNPEKIKLYMNTSVIWNICFWSNSVSTAPLLLRSGRNTRYISPWPSKLMGVLRSIGKT